MKTSGYSESELMQMQQDALRRVREMQERARANLEASGWVNSQNIPVGTPGTAPAPPPLVGGQNGGGARGQALPNQNGGHGNTGSNSTGASGQNGHGNTGSNSTGGLGGILPGLDFGNLFSGNTSSPIAGLLDWAGGDRGVLLILLVVLMGENSDKTLLLALFYLLMFE